MDSRIWHWFNKHGDTSKSSDDLLLKLAWTKSVMIDLISVGSCSSEFNCFSVYPKLKEKMCQNYIFSHFKRSKVPFSKWITFFFFFSNWKCGIFIAGNTANMTERELRRFKLVMFLTFLTNSFATNFFESCARCKFMWFSFRFYWFLTARFTNCKWWWFDLLMFLIDLDWCGFK